MLFSLASDQRWSHFFVLCFSVSLCVARPSAFNISAVSLYAPRRAECPSGPVVRPAIGLSPAEEFYIKLRKRKASRALASWLQSVDEKFPTHGLPTLALATSGGGYRSMLVGAGVVQAFDGRDSDSASSGLYQGLTYHSGLSGGGWLLSSIHGNGHETVSTLQDELWSSALVNNSLWPLNTDSAPEYPAIKADLKAKNAAGFPPTITDVWGRFLSYQLLRGPSGGAAKDLSSIARSRSFLTFNSPYPIMTSMGVNDINNPTQCDPLHDSLQYEYSPYEFGSWDKGVAAFTKTEYLGSKISNGAASDCTKNYDTLSYMLGSSSSKFQEECGTSGISFIAGFLKPEVLALRNETEASRRDLYAPFRNPFYKYPGSPTVSESQELYLVDGGQADQNNPLWPFLQTARGVDVVIVNDNSADTDFNYPNGTELLQTYIQSQRANLTKMPFIPPVAEFVAKGLHQRATFFGCNDPDKLTLIFLPNFNYTSFDAGQPSSRFEYAANDTAAMIEVGNRVALQNGDEKWPKCLGCGIVSKTKGVALPDGCKECLEKYCYRQ